MNSFRIFYLIFFLSGATGLVYQVIWVRLTGLVFGNTSHAIAVVLGAFMAGLALGSWRLGRKADQVQSSLKLYGILEIGIGVSAALVPFIFGALDSLYWALAPSLEGIPGGNGFIRFLTSFLVLIVPTFLMGGTLPALARFFTHSVEEVQRKIGVLYALNTFGAAFGTLTAALLFIPVLGNIRSTLIIATLNVGIGLVTIAMDRRWSAAAGPAPAPAPAPLTSPAGSRDGDAASDRLVLMTLATSGFVAMIYEVAWTRSLTAMIGSSTYAFSIMLVTFLVGIALGSSLAGRWRAAANIRLLGLTQLGVAIGAVIFLVGYLAAPYVLVGLMRAFSYSFPAILTSQFLVCAFVMILATLCMGATMPIASQLYSNRLVVLGRSIGDVYSVNTIGAIAGSLVAGFVLLPLIGTERTILAGLFFNSALALVLLSSPLAEQKRSIAKWAALALLIVATLSMRGRIFWLPGSLDRGILVYAEQFGARPELTIGEHYQDTDVVYFKEGNNATISVRRGEDYLGLRTNGKVDASNKSDMQTQLMIGYLPLIYHAAPRSTLIVGYGSGVTVGAATTFNELEEIDCIEIEPAVMGAAPWFSDINRQSFEHPKVNIIYDDARTFMNVTRKQYDVIISEPSNPWIAGVASLFTAEFYERAAQVLKPDGVFAQWVQLYELDPEDLRMIIGEFQRQFPEISMWNSGGDLILIGTRQPQKLNLQRWVQLAEEDPGVNHELGQYFNMTEPEGLLAYYVMSTEQVRDFGVTNRRNTDDHPLLEFHAPRQLFRNTRDLNVDLLFASKQDLIPAGAEIPDAAQAFKAMVEPFLNMSRSDLALQAMTELAELEREDEAPVQLARARINLDQGHLAATEAALESAAEAMEPGSNLVAEREELAGLYKERLGADDEAIEHFLAAAAADPVRPLPLRKLAELHGGKQAWDEATHWMQQYLATKPAGIGHQWAMLGDYYLAGAHPEKAIEAFQTAIAIDPYTFWARYRLARLLEEQTQIPEAIEQYEFTVRYALDREPDIYLKLANLYRGQGRTDDARDLLEKGVRVFPTHSEVYRLYREVAGGE